MTIASCILIPLLQLGFRSPSAFWVWWNTLVSHYLSYLLTRISVGLSFDIPWVVMVALISPPELFCMRTIGWQRKGGQFFFSPWGPVICYFIDLFGTCCNCVVSNIALDPTRSAVDGTLGFGFWTATFLASKEFICRPSSFCAL